MFSLLFLVSGAAGLIYEIVWERLLELYFGVTMTAITLIVAAYMAGLGLGSLSGGRIARRLRSTLAAYGWIEIGIGLFGLASPALITGIGARTAGSPYPLVFLLSFALLLIPTFLMGMTLPILTQSFVDRVDSSGRVIGLLYGINTLGAAFGAILTGYFFIGWIGYDGAVHIAILLNALVGTWAVSSGLRSGPAARKRLPAAARPIGSKRSMRWSYPTILFASFSVGFIHLGFEMLWVRILGIINKTTAYHFPTVLFVFLIGLAIGGAVWGRKADQTSDPIRLFWEIEIAVGVLAAISILLFRGALQFEPLQSWIQKSFYGFQQPPAPFLTIKHDILFSIRLLFSGLIQYFIPIAVMVLPASAAMGGGLPVLDRIAIDRPQVSGRRVGDIHLANIAGSAAGSLAVSFLFLPLAGSELTYKILVSSCFGFLLLDVFARKQPWTKRSAIYHAAALIVAIMLLPGRGQFYSRLYEAGSRQPVIVRESGDSVLALSLRQAGGSPSRLWIGGVQNSYFPTDGRYERIILACAGVSHPRRILIIGLGGGNTAFFASRLPRVEEIVIVELMSELAPFLSEHVAQVDHLLSDARVDYILDDGRRYLYSHPSGKFDLISIDPLFSFTAGHNNLYSMEAMQLYRDHLSDGGVFCAWTDEERVLPLTAAMVFPQTDSFREFVIAADHPLRYDVTYMDSALKNYQEALGDALTPAVLDTLSPAKMISRFRADQDLILAEGRGMPYLTDMNPWLEYYLFHAPLAPQGKPADRHAFLRRVVGCYKECGY